MISLKIRLQICMRIDISAHCCVCMAYGNLAIAACCILNFIIGLQESCYSSMLHIKFYRCLGYVLYQNANLHTVLINPLNIHRHNNHLYFKILIQFFFSGVACNAHVCTQLYTQARPQGQVWGGSLESKWN